MIDTLLTNKATSDRVHCPVKMNDPKITMEEYIRLEEEKAHRHGKVYNWETATYGKIWDYEDVHDLRFVETEFLAIVFNDTLTLKQHSHVSLRYFVDLDFFKDFKNEFPAIVYNDAQTSKSDLLTEPTLNPQRINEFDLNDETSLSKCDEEEQNILNFNYLFPFNVIYPNDLKSDKDNDDDKININDSSRDNVMNTDDAAYAQSQNSCDFTTVIIIGESEERRITEGIIRSYYDHEDGETTPRFEEFV
ncbi:hypothetical protein Tco_1212856 [Tanacetum coccineum]